MDQYHCIDCGYEYNKSKVIDVIYDYAPFNSIRYFTPILPQLSYQIYCIIVYAELYTIKGER